MGVMDNRKQMNPGGDGGGGGGGGGGGMLYGGSGEEMRGENERKKRERGKTLKAIHGQPRGVSLITFIGLPFVLCSLYFYLFIFFKIHIIN